MEGHSLPVYKIVQEGDYEGLTYSVLKKEEAESVPEALRNTFLSDHEVTHVDGNSKTIFLTPQKVGKTSITRDVRVRISNASADAIDYIGTLSDFLSSAYKFSRKSKKSLPPVVSIINGAPNAQYLIDLAQARNRSREWGNGRGDIQGTPQYFRAISEQFAKENSEVSITVISGDELVKEGFRLLHSVGRASKNEPVFVNLSYKGNPNSDKWVAYVGKGVCFDTGGLDIKTAAGMLHMFLDKCGAMNVLSAFQTVVKQKVPVNLTCSIGLVQNSINENAYRPSDIIISRKGLSIQIGNTDAEGRLVLADCMHWTQQKFNVDVLIELSTLTGAIGTALGTYYSGLFTNNEDIVKVLRTLGEKVHEQSWHLPCNDYHKNLVVPKHADLTNSSGKTEASASQAAAFLRHFVEENTKWVHFDIGSTGMIGGEATGWGSRLLVEYAHYVAKH